MPDRKPPSAPDSDQDTTVLVSPSTGAYLDRDGTPAGTPVLTHPRTGLPLYAGDTPAPTLGARDAFVSRRAPGRSHMLAALAVGRWLRWGCDPDALGALGGRR